MPRERKPAPVVDESKRWLDSYADAITLLMAFFVMLFAFSLVDQTKFEAFRRGIAETLGRSNPVAEGGIGLLEQGNGIAELIPAPPAVTQNGNPGEGDASSGTDGADRLEGIDEITTEEEAEELRRQIEERLAEINAEEFVEVTRDERGVVITFDEVVLFPSGRATINLDGQIVLGTVAQALRPFGNLIAVEGHTDSVPTSGSDWPTNWELGAIRSVNVTRYFSEIGGIPGAQLQVVTYGEYRPREPNESAAGRAANRRVEVIVVVAGLADTPPDLTEGLFGLDAVPQSEHSRTGTSAADTAREQSERQATIDASRFPSPATPNAGG